MIKLEGEIMPCIYHNPDKMTNVQKLIMCHALSCAFIATFILCNIDLNQKALIGLAVTTVILMVFIVFYKIMHLVDEEE